MVTRTTFYSDLDERTKQIRNNTFNNGFRVLHDDFIDRENNPTDGLSGRLTFTNDPDPQGPVIPKEQVTTDEINRRIKQQFIDENNLEEINSTPQPEPTR